ncbi:MAG: ISL3 family transposase [Syntrophobacteria bacterium]
MQVKTILNQCHKFKCFVYDKVRFVVEHGERFIEVTMVPRRNSQAICSGCGQPAPLYDQLKRRRFEFIPLWGYRVFLVYRMRRVNCAGCGVKVEQVPWARGKRELTDTYQQFLAHWAKKLSWKEVAVSFRTSWEKVFQAVEYVVEWGLEHRTLRGITAIGVDEIAWRKGQHYLTLVYQIDTGSTRLLWIGKARTVKTLLRFFRFFGKERSQELKYVCSDMWQPYLKVIAKKAGQALHILDRFHIVAKLNKAIDEVRAGEHRQLQKDGYEPVLKHSRWCLLKRGENLTEKQEAKLKDLLQYNLKSVRAYLLKEDFNGFWEYVSPAWAGKFLDRWCTRVMRSRIEPMKKVAKSIRNHKPLILNWFKAKKAFSSGVVEGLNNKAKVTTRNAYGFRTYRGAEVALYHALGNLPSPPMTHRFC